MARRLIAIATLWCSGLLLGAHTTSVTSIDARLTTTNLALTLQLQQPDLIQIAREGPLDKFHYANDADFRTNSAWIAEYVTNRVHVSFFATNSHAILSNWPPAELPLTIEIRPDQIEPALIPFTLSWPIPKEAKELKIVFNLYDRPLFEALFQVLFDLGPETMPVMHVVPGGRETIIDLAALAEDLETPPPPSPSTAAEIQAEATNPPPATTDGTTNQPAATNAPAGKDTRKTAFRFSATQFISIGFEHILPKGLDHILFVVALFFLSTRWQPLLWQVTAFTLAHSLTLGLAMAGVFELSPKIVEPLIALSIAAVAIENLYRDRVSRWRWLGVFGFGLIHGLGFAGVLGEMTIPEGHFATSLLCFNLGVELGQLAVIAIAYAAVFAIVDRPWYPRYVRAPACYLLAAVGLFWTVQRIFF